MSASSGSDTAGPAAAAHLDAQLCTAWLLRNHVLRDMYQSDKGPLALALPAALAAPCCRPLNEDDTSLDVSEYLLPLLVGACVPQRLCPATCALFVRWQPLRWCAARALVPSTALLLAACAALSRCPVALAAAASVVAALPPYKGVKLDIWVTEENPREYALQDSPLLHALLAAVVSGSTAATTAAVHEVAGSRGTQPPLLIAVRAACRMGSAEALAMLDSAPFTPVALDVADGGAALTGACMSGCLAAVRRLAEAPYCLGSEHAKHNECQALKWAMVHGHADIVRELSQPPWSLGEEQVASRDDISVDIQEACSSIDTEVVEVLMQPPYNGATEIWNPTI
eukprot:m51a1_g8599 hypothetical protein (341) ;mRNA; f:150664-152034